MDNKKKVCEPANSQNYRASDSKKLSADAKILIALKNKQPLKRLELCKEASINEATFSRYKRLLINRGIIKETSKGYALSDYDEKPSLWQRLLDDLKAANGNLKIIRFYRLSLVGPRDPITGWLKKKYDEYRIEGVIILKGALELEAKANITFSDFNSLAVLTQALIDEGDVMWFRELYEARKVKPIFEGVDLSYRIVWLTIAPQLSSLIPF